MLADEVLQGGRLCGTLPRGHSLPITMGTLVTSMLRRESASITIAITSSPARTPVEVAERFSRGQTERPLISARPDGNPTAGGYLISQ
jgi:hypothetical protein